MPARSSKARSVVEFGTSFGLSTLHLAAASKDNGGGKLIGSEFESAKVIRARENLALAGLAEFVEIREGDALSPGAIVVANNADGSPEYLEHVRESRNGYLSLPFADDVELSVRVKG